MRALRTVSASTMIARARRVAQGQMSHGSCGNISGARDVLSAVNRVGN